MNAVVVNGEHFCSIAAKDKTDAVRVKTNAAREDWKNIMSSLHNRETSLQVSTGLRSLVELLVKMSVLNKTLSVCLAVI